MTSRGITPFQDWARQNIRIRNKFITDPISELLATFIVVLFAVGANAQYQLMPNQPFLMPVFAGVGGLFIAVVAFGGASGAHVNPTVSLALAIYGKLSWIMLPLFFVAQFLGAYLGAGVAFAIYKHKLCVSGGDTCVEAVGIFSALPSVPVGTGFLDQIVSVTVLVVFIFGLLDHRNANAHKSLYGIYFALAVATCATGFGINAGAALNPARDIGARLMAITLGHPVKTIFLYGDEHYWTVPMFGPLIGAILGTIIYVVCVGSHLDDDESTTTTTTPSTENSDWRSTVFVAKRANLPQTNLHYPAGSGSIPVAANNPYNAAQVQYNGQHNNIPSYYAEEPKPQRVIY